MRFEGYDIPVTVRKTCRRLILHAQDGKLSLSVPPGTPEQTVRDFLSQHIDWVRAHAGCTTQFAPTAPVRRPPLPRMIRLGDFEIAVTPRANCRRMVLHARQGEGTLTLSVPQNAAEQEVRDFLSRNQAWIAQHGHQAQDWTPRFAPGEVHPLFGQMVVLGRGGIPSGTAFEQLRMERLAAFVSQTLPDWARRMNVMPRDVRFRTMTSRWGSCQVRTHDVTFNTNLAKMPPDCIEYVIVHELCHLIVPDHSPAFHAAMTRFLPDWQERRTRLNQFDTTPRPHA